jgi:protein-L-isoaspartate(D-aspartate) O-methyltransferase
MTEHNFEQMRRAMVVGSLRTTGVSDPRVLAAMGAVPRERFVPPERCAIAYADNPVPLGTGANSIHRWRSAACSPKPRRNRRSARS